MKLGNPSNRPASFTEVSTLTTMNGDLRAAAVGITRLGEDGKDK